MVDFNINDRIVTLENSKLRYGMIDNLFDTIPPVALIKFDDGGIVKLLTSQIAHEPKPMENGPDEKTLLAMSMLTTLNKIIDVTFGDELIAYED